MIEAEVKAIIQKKLPHLLSEDPQVRDFVLRVVADYYASKPETESRFDRILNELERDRQEQARKWDEQNRLNQEVLSRLDHESQEQTQKWDEQTRKWDEQNRQNQALLQEIQAMNRNHESSIEALGSRWGIASEISFRNALQGILEESFGVQVLNLNLFD